MKIEIHYCAVWNFEPNAAGVAEELKKELGIEANLVAGRNGIFDVTVDDDLVFSKFETGRFPEPGEILNLIKP